MRLRGPEEMGEGAGAMVRPGMGVVMQMILDHPSLLMDAGMSSSGRVATEL